MSEPDRAAERQLLRSIRRRSLVKGLVGAIPVVALWWLLSHWIARRYGIEAHLANLGTLLLVTSCLGVLLRWLGLDQLRDPRETPRLRWLLKERSDRITSRARRFWIGSMSLAVLLGAPIMLLDQGGSSDLTDGCMVVLILMGASGPNLPWRLPKTMDELEQAHYLASHRAYALTVWLCVGALVLNHYWPGRLAGLISLSLLIGILAQQIGLEIQATRAVAHNE